MKRIIFNIAVITFIIYALSCSHLGGKSSYISSFERFVEKVTDNQATYSDEDWERADVRFEQFADTDYQKYSRKLTKEEKQKIGKLKGKYLAIRTKSATNILIDNINDALEQLDGVVEGFTEELDNQDHNE